MSYAERFILAKKNGGFIKHGNMFGLSGLTLYSLEASTLCTYLLCLRIETALSSDFSYHGIDQNGTCFPRPCITHMWHGRIHTVYGREVCIFCHLEVVSQPDVARRLPSE